MVSIISKPDTLEKLKILSGNAQYDLACACGSGKTEHRKRASENKWIYPVTLPNGGKSTLFKTLFSNSCSNDCKYCPLRADEDFRRCSLTPEQTAQAFLDYHSRREVFGMFLSSAVLGSPDSTMQELIDTAEILRRKHQFRGYIHLKILPGASPAAIEKAISLSSAVSLNIETPGEKYLSMLSRKKDFLRDIIEPMKLISKLTGKGQRYSRVKQTTQFIVGPAGEPDSEIIKYTAGLYSRLGLSRIYFSAYQDPNEPKPEKNIHPNSNQILTREHRLYQADYLFRKYGFTEEDFLFDSKGNLDLSIDPKQVWAQRHPEFFPVNINSADEYELLRVPGLGPVTVKRILKQRTKSRFNKLGDIGKGHWIQKAAGYIRF